MRALGYFNLIDHRVTKTDYEQLFSVFCERYLHQPIGVYCDVTEGFGKNTLTEFERMLDYMENEKSDFLIMIPDASHIGTDIESVTRSLLRLESKGSKVICDDDELPDPLQNALVTHNVKGVSKERSAKIRDSMKQRALLGKGLGKPPYGYRNGINGNLEIVDEEAPVVELIFRLYTNRGIGLRLIAQELNGRGLKTRRGGQWNMVTLRDILKNTAYMGTYTRFGLRLPKSHPQIIESSVFREAQDVTRSRKPLGRISQVDPFLLSGLLYCGNCNKNMMGVTRRQTWKKKDGRRSSGVYRYYQCQSRNNMSVCGYHTWRANLLETTVSNQLRHIISGPTSIPLNKGVLSHWRQEMKLIWDQRVRNAERRFNESFKRAARGEMDIFTLGEYIFELDRARSSSGYKEQPSGESILLTDWMSVTFQQKRDFLFEYIRRIRVDDDSIEIESRLLPNSLSSDRHVVLQ